MLTRNKWIILILLIIATALMVWEMLPQEKISQSFSYRSEESKDYLSDCIRSSGIPEIQWELSYPASLEAKQTESIFLTIYPGALAGKIENNVSDCDVILATRFEGDNIKITPGETLFFAFNRSVVQRVNWNISAISGDINGKIWIYAITDAGSTNEEKAALFVIPVLIRNKLILGFSSQLFV